MEKCFAESFSSLARRLRIALAEGFAHSGEGQNRAAPRDAQGFLIGRDHLLDPNWQIDPLTADGSTPFQVVPQGWREHLQHEAGFPAARNARDRHQRAHGERDIDPTEVVEMGRANLDPGQGRNRVAHSLECGGAAQQGARARSGNPHQFLRRAHGHQASPLGPGARPQLEDVIRQRDEGSFVLHQDDGVARIREAPQHAPEALDIARVKALGGFVQHVRNAHEPAPQGGREAHPLGLAAREARHLPLQG